MPLRVKLKSGGWRDEIWEIIRYYRSIGKNKKTVAGYWLDRLVKDKTLHVVSKIPNEDPVSHGKLPVSQQTVEQFQIYMRDFDCQFENAFEKLRTEDEALTFCKKLGVKVLKTRTKSSDHHQASKAIIATVNNIVHNVCMDFKIDYVTDQTTRCVWLQDEFLHVTARNLDGAIPGLINPLVVWEIKEYWGKTSGGSKMSDALYECQLVGREIREYEEKCDRKVIHMVFLDGKDQWQSRVSDFVRFLDIFNQGLIDYLYIGREIESVLENDLRQLLKS